MKRSILFSVAVICVLLITCDNVFYSLASSGIDDISSGDGYIVKFDKNNTDEGSVDAKPLTIIATKNEDDPPTYTTDILPQKEPTRVGYIFTGWNNQADRSGEDFFADTPVVKNTIVYAQWLFLPNVYYIVKFDKNNDDVNNQEAHPQNKAVIPPSINVSELPIPPYRNGYDFDGWKDKDGDEFGTGYKVEKSMSVYAQWKAFVCEVTFDKNSIDGNAIFDDASPKAITVKYPATTISILPTPPTSDRYDFIGWKDASGKVFDENTPVFPTDSKGRIQRNEAMTVYAQWAEKTYSVSGKITKSDGGGASGARVELIGSMNLTTTAGADGSYTFTGVLSRNGYTVRASLAKYSTETTDPFNVSWADVTGKDLTLERLWEVSGKVFNDVSGSPVLGATVILPQSNDSPATTDASGYYVLYVPNGTYNIAVDCIGYVSSNTNPITVSGNNVPLDVNLTPITYTVRFHANNETVVTKDQSFIYGIAQPLEINTFTYGTYTFMGWATSEGGSVEHTDGKNVIDLATTQGAIVNLYAKWNITYTVTFDTNGATGGTTPPAQTVSAGSSITLPSGAGLSKTGFAFGGWNTLSDGNGTNYNAGASYTVNGNATLHAKWNSTYKVHFNANGGTGTMADQDFVYGTPQYLRSNTFTRTNFTFVEWNTDAGGGDTSYTNGQSVSNLTATPGGIFNLYAQWLASYTVTYNANANGDNVTGMPSPNPVLNVAHGAKIIEPLSEPSRNGYTFGGWYREAAGTTAWNFDSDTVTANTPLYAKWTAKTYTVTYIANANGDNVDDMPDPNPVTNVEHGTTISQPSPNPSRYGYTFNGWYREATGTNAWNFATNTVTAETPLYAKWTQNTYTVTYYANANGDNVTGMPSPNPVLNVAHGLPINKPSPDPSRNGYTFGGWYREAAGTTAWNFDSDTVTANTPLYAKWIDIYTVTFNSNGGSSVTPQRVDSGKTATRPTNPPIRTGYNFIDWYSNSGMATPPYDFGAPVTKDITLHAKWTFTVSGNIYLDVSGNPAIGATVQLILPNWDDLNAPYDLNVTSITDANGYYEFPSTPLDIGKGYVIIASFPGYTSNAISVDDKLVINLTLLNSGPETRGASQSFNLKQLLLPLKK